MVDINAWRVRIGTFNGTRSCRSSSHCRPSSSETALLSLLLHISHLIASTFDMLSEIFIHALLLALVMLDIFCITILHFFNVIRLCANSRAPSTCKSFFTILLPIFMINSSSISLVLRLLLLQSGDVEPNPGPPSPKLLSFAVWNVDSLLARDNVKKSLIESIQSINNFDMFGICETYLTDNHQDSDLDLEGFAKNPMRADFKPPNPQSRPRGGVCLYYKESLPIKRRSDLELLDETICAEISLNRKKLSISSHIGVPAKRLLNSTPTCRNCKQPL